MKLAPVSVIVFVSLLLSAGCKKNNGGGSTTGPPLGSHTKRWLVKDVMTQEADNKLYHSIFSYNDTGLILKIDQAVSNDINHPETYGITCTYEPSYTPAGKLAAMKISQSPGYNYVYVSNFSIQITPVPFDAVHDGVSTVNFSLHGNNEMDIVKSFTPPASTSGFNYSYTKSFSYGATGGLQSVSVTNYYGVDEDLWASYSSGGMPVANSFSNGTTIEQRLLYYMYSSVHDWDVLGPSWSDGTMESYTYASGTKAIKGRFFNDYTVDGNKNVVKVITSYSIAGSGLNNYVKLPPATISYEQH